MPAARRPQLDDRRRLVIYSQRYSADAPAQNQRAKAGEAALRGARKPAAAYGWRVQRRLRARWFGIVPVRRRALLAVVASILGIVAVLALGHWASLWWPPIALRPALARPLRLDRPDSLGTWLGAVMMAAAAGGSLMVYQLRRYRADDYRGHYRMWRIAIVLCLLASVDAVIHSANWLGAAIDILLAERDVLAGADWIRLLMTVGGAAFGFRIAVELARCPTAAATMVFSLALFGISSATRWNLLRIEEATAVTWLPITLIAGRALFLIAVVVYLRTLYREVRKLESSNQFSRLRKLVQWRRPTRRRKDHRDEQDEASEARSPAAETAPRRSAKRTPKRAAAERTEEIAETKPGWRARFSFGRRSKVAAPDAAADEEASGEDADEASESSETAPRKRFGLSFRRRAKSADEEASGQDADEASETNETAPRKRFGLSFRRRAKSADEEAASEDADVSTESSETAPRKRFGLSFRRRAKSADEDASGESPDAPTESDENPPRKRFGLPFRRRAAAAEDSGAREAADGERPSRGPQRSAPPQQAPARQSREAADDDDDGDSDESALEAEGVDWESLNKSERRRARKLLKRQGKAA